MFKVPRQEYAVELKELAVKRAEAEEGSANGKTGVSATHANAESQSKKRRAPFGAPHRAFLPREARRMAFYIF